MIDPYDWEEPLDAGSAIAGAFYGVLFSSPIWIAMGMWAVQR